MHLFPGVYQTCKQAAHRSLRFLCRSLLDGVKPIKLLLRGKTMVIYLDTGLTDFTITVEVHFATPHYQKTSPTCLGSAHTGFADPIITCVARLAGGFVPSGM